MAVNNVNQVRKQQYTYISFATMGFASAIPLSKWWSTHDRNSLKGSNLYFQSLKQASSGLEHSASRVTGHVKPAATSPTKTVWPVVRRPCSSLRDRAWNNVRQDSTRTCDSATTLLANRVRILASNACRAPTVQCVTRLCCCKPANVVRRVPQGMYIVIYNQYCFWF